MANIISMQNVRYKVVITNIINARGRGSYLVNRGGQSTQLTWVKVYYWSNITLLQLKVAKTDFYR